MGERWSARASLWKSPVGERRRRAIVFPRKSISNEKIPAGAKKIPGTSILPVWRNCVVACLDIQNLKL